MLSDKEELQLQQLQLLKWLDQRSGSDAPHPASSGEVLGPVKEELGEYRYIYLGQLREDLLVPQT